jgi:type II secretory pathway predicted ATPase ExeA
LLANRDQPTYLRTTNNRHTMYEPYFGLSERPFGAAARMDRFFPAAAIDAARDTLERVLARAEGLGVAIGGVGTGKTLLATLLAESQRATARVALLASTRLIRRRALLQAILHALARPYRGMDESELRLALGDALGGTGGDPRPVALIVDDAHTLRASVLDEIRLLLDHVRLGEPLVRAVLVGAPLLEDHLASPKIEALSQRIAARTYLQTFTRAETIEYVKWQIQACGGSADRLFEPQSLDALFKATDGLPRIVNQLADHALLLAMAAERRQVDAAIVEEAWSDLQQLPTPWNVHSVSGASRPTAIEFGELAENDSEPASIPFRSPEPESATAVLEADATSGVFEWDGAPTGVLPPDDDTDDEYRPAGTFSTEVEIVFDDRDNPFKEPFAAEEVVADRSAVIESEWAKVHGPAASEAAPKPATPSSVEAVTEIFQSDGGPVAEQQTADPQTADSPIADRLVAHAKDASPRPRRFKHLFADLRRAQ